MKGAGSSGESRCRRPESDPDMFTDLSEPQCRLAGSEPCGSIPLEKDVSPTSTVPTVSPSTVPTPRRVDSFTSSSSWDDRTCSENGTAHDESPQVLSVNMFSMYATGDYDVFTGDDAAESESLEDGSSIAQEIESEAQPLSELALEEETIKTLGSDGNGDEVRNPPSTVSAPAERRHSSVKSSGEDEASLSQETASQQPFVSMFKLDAPVEKETNSTLGSSEESISKQERFDDEVAITSFPAYERRKHQRFKTLPASLDLGAALSDAEHKPSAARLESRGQYHSQESESQQPFGSMSKLDAPVEKEANSTLGPSEESISKQERFDDGVAVTRFPSYERRKHQRIKTLPASLDLGAALSNAEHKPSAARLESRGQYASEATGADARLSSMLPKPTHRRNKSASPLESRGQSGLERIDSSARPSHMLPKPAHRRTQTLPSFGLADLDMNTLSSVRPPRPHRVLTAHTTLGDMMKMCGDATSPGGTLTSPTSLKPSHRRVQTLPTSVMAEMFGAGTAVGGKNTRPGGPPRPRSGLPPRPNRMQPPRPTTLSPHAPVRQQVPGWSSSSSAKSTNPTHRRTCSAPMNVSLNMASVPSVGDCRESTNGGSQVQQPHRRHSDNFGSEDLSSPLCNLPTEFDVPDPKLLAGRRRHNRSQSYDSRNSSAGSAAGDSTPPDDDKNSPEYCWNKYYEKQKLKKNVVKEEIRYRLGKVVPKQLLSKRADLKRADSGRFV